MTDPKILKRVCRGLGIIQPAEDLKYMLQEYGLEIAYRKRDISPRIVVIESRSGRLPWRFMEESYDDETADRRVKFLTEHCMGGWIYRKAVYQRVETVEE